LIAVGPGKVALLEAVARTGSITAAARDLGMSYPRAWKLVDELNQAMNEPAVTSEKGGEHGGSSVLTPAGRRLIATYRRIERNATAANRAELASLFALLR
jgi:molybdate transport system regulatory protein